MYTLKAYKSSDTTLESALKDNAFTIVDNNLSCGGELDTVLNAFRKGLGMFGFIQDVECVLFDRSGFLPLVSNIDYSKIHLEKTFNSLAKPILKQYRYEVQYKIVGFDFYSGTVAAKNVDAARQKAYNIVYDRLCDVNQFTIEIDIDLDLDVDHIKIYESEEV